MLLSQREPRVRCRVSEQRRDHDARPHARAGVQERLSALLTDDPGPSRTSVDAGELDQN